MKVYLGDSVYVDEVNGMFMLTTENGGPPSNIIYLEWDVYQNLIRYAKQLEGDEDAE